MPPALCLGIPVSRQKSLKKATRCRDNRSYKKEIKKKQTNKQKKKQENKVGMTVLSIHEFPGQGTLEG